MKKKSLQRGLVALLFFLFIFSHLSLVNSKSDDYWTINGVMPKARGDLGAVTLNGKIYVIAADLNYEYDPNSQTWISKTPMPTPREYFGVGVVDGKIFVIGGLIDGSNYTGINEAYDPINDIWEKKASMPTPRWDLDANVIDEKIYLIGGYGGWEINEAYDPSNDSWIQKKGPLSPVYGYASTVTEDKIFLIGGHIGGGIFTNLNQIYDPKQDNWIYGQAAPQKVVSGAAISTTGINAPEKIYVLGVSAYLGIGTNEGQAVPSVINHIYNPENDTWIVGSPPAINRLNAAMANLDDKLYAIGGYTYEKSGLHTLPVESDVIEEYIPLEYQGPSKSETKVENNTILLLSGAIAIGTILCTVIIFYFRKSNFCKS